MSSKLYLGLTKHFEYPSGGFLLICDEIPKISQARVFDPLKNTFNPLKNITDKTAREFADVLYTIYPQGENTLTVRNGRRELLTALLQAKRFDKVHGSEEVTGLVTDILNSSVLKRVLTETEHAMSFNTTSRIVARLNRAEIGDFAALTLGLLLIGHFKGQLMVEDFGFYGRLAHVSLIRENRLIAGLNTLSEVPPKLRDALMLIKDKEGSGTLYEDAEELAKYAGRRPGTNEFNDFVDAAMA